MITAYTLCHGHWTVIPHQQLAITLFAQKTDPEYLGRPPGFRDWTIWGMMATWLGKAFSMKSR